jgi:hypothetical protein
LSNPKLNRDTAFSQRDRENVWILQRNRQD